MRAKIRIVLLLLLLPAVPVAADEMSRDARRLFDTARRMARATRFGERQAEMLEKKMEGLGAADLEAVIDALRAEEEPGKSAAAVLDFLEKRCLGEKYGPLAAEKIDGLYTLLRSTEAKDMEGLVSAALMLPDLRLAKELTVRYAKAEPARVRQRAAMGLGDLLAYGETGDEVRSALAGLVSDPEAAVRAVTLRRGFEVRFDPVFELAIARLDDDAKATTSIRGEGEEVRPGEEALRGLTELTWVQRELTYGQYLRLSAEEKETLVGLFRAWWKGKGESFPTPGFREAAFRERPTRTETVLIPKNETTATVQFWSSVDRTRVRVHIDEIQVAATTHYDWRVNFHVAYMASGMRPDDGEAFARDQYIGTPYVLARKKTGCIVLVFQYLIDGRLKVRLDFHDPVR